MAFIASILDLSRILQQGKPGTDPGPAQPLITTREIAYAFSNSLRFIFFWIFVAQPPKAERDTPNARAGTHSGNWDVWGFVGLGLRWLTLSLSLAVFALQVVWRLDSRANEFTNAYSADSAIEVILSAILVLKILLNCSHCTVTSKWICILDYLGFLVSLNLTIGFGIANIMHRESLFAFIRTTRCDTGRNSQVYGNNSRSVLAGSQFLSPRTLFALGFIHATVEAEFRSRAILPPTFAKANRFVVQHYPARRFNSRSLSCSAPTRLTSNRATAAPDRYLLVSGENVRMVCNPETEAIEPQS
jgi:hypothetical protein